MLLNPTARLEKIKYLQHSTTMSDDKMTWFVCLLNLISASDTKDCTRAASDHSDRNKKCQLYNQIAWHRIQYPIKEDTVLIVQTVSGWLIDGALFSAKNVSEHKTMTISLKTLNVSIKCTLYM